jgi:hypothetical protein
MKTFILGLIAVSAAAQQHTSFPTDDGGLIFADVYGAGSRGVVLGFEYWCSTFAALANRKAQASPTSTMRRFTWMCSPQVSAQ